MPKTYNPTFSIINWFPALGVTGFVFSTTFGAGLAEVFETKKGEKARAKTITMPGNINHLNSCDFFMAYPGSERKLLLGLETSLEIKPTLNIQFGAVECAAASDFVRV